MLRAVYDGFIRILSVKLKLNIMKKKKVLKIIMGITFPIWIVPAAVVYILYGFWTVIMDGVDIIFETFGWDKKS